MKFDDFREQVVEQISHYMTSSDVVEASHRLMGVNIDEKVALRLYITTHFIIECKMFDEFSLKHDAIIKEAIENMCQQTIDDINEEK